MGMAKSKSCLDGRAAQQHGLFADMTTESADAEYNDW
jgi:hypothetical protein